MINSAFSFTLQLGSDRQTDARTDANSLFAIDESWWIWEIARRNLRQGQGPQKCKRIRFEPQLSRFLQAKCVEIAAWNQRRDRVDEEYSFHPLRGSARRSSSRFISLWKQWQTRYVACERLLTSYKQELNLAKNLLYENNLQFLTLMVDRSTQVLTTMFFNI